MKNERNIGDIAIGETVELTDAEVKFAREIAEIMDAFGKEVAANGGSHQAGFQLAGARVKGIKGELAYCKLANVYPMAFDVTSLDNYDCMHSGLRVDVKTSEGLVMNVNENQGRRADVYVLMQMRGNEFKFLGRISSKRLMEWPLTEGIDGSMMRAIPCRELR
jgi:hypothetical protein